MNSKKPTQPVNSPKRKAPTSTQRSRDRREENRELRDQYIEYMGDVSDTRSLDVFLAKTPGITRKMISEWSKMPSVKEAIRERLDESVVESKPLALKAMVRDMSGSGKAPSQAAKTFLEVTGQWTPTSKQKVEVGRHDDLNQMTEEELQQEVEKTREQMADDGTDWREQASVIRGGKVQDG